MNFLSPNAPHPPTPNTTEAAPVQADVVRTPVSPSSTDTSTPAAQKAITEEQHFVDSAYAALDTEHAYYSQQLEQVRAAGASGTPAARSERDSFATHYEDNLARLRGVENRLVLGRLDFDDPKSQPPRHIGRITLRDPDQQIILTDWRAPQSEPFYQATAAQRGDVARRRHIHTRMREVTAVEDELLATGHSSDASLNLTGEGALIAAMSRARGGKMGDIVATIQAEQDAVIRAEGRGVLVVQGGPGTGKTAVALHRAAFLLYRERERLSSSGVLLIGPSRQFLHYIDQVLPSLGESNVVACTIDELFPGVTPSVTDSDEAGAIKSKIVWREIARRAVPLVLQKPLSTPATMRINGKKLTLSPADITQAQRRARQSGKPHNQAREAYARYLVSLLAERLARALEVRVEDSPWLIEDIASDPDAKRIINLHWLPASPQWLLEHIFAWPEILERVAPELSAGQRAALHRPKGSGFSQADIPLLDELAEHLGPLISDLQRARDAAKEKEATQLANYVNDTMQAMGLGGGIVSNANMVARTETHRSATSIARDAAMDRSWTYGHVVVDEAQELTEMQWAMIARRNPARSLTIVGDLDQRVHSAPVQSWREALGADLSRYAREKKLTISYRTPASILNRAGEAMAALGHPVRAVRGVRDIMHSYSCQQVAADQLLSELTVMLETEWQYLESEYGHNLGTIAVITPSTKLAQEAQHTVTAHKDWGQAVNLSADASQSRIRVLLPEQTKGLEYDSVIILEPAEIGAISPGNLYVALTRATKHVRILSTAPVPEGL